MVGDHANVLARSRPLILDPLFGHNKEQLRIQDRNLRETLKELSLLDGAFVISNDGSIEETRKQIDELWEKLKKIQENKA